MAEKRKKNQIIFVNSFKGGAGKTTLALTHCINDLFHEHKFDNVIYIDLDILGTATSYLFDKDKLPPEKCFNNTGEEMKITLEYDNESRDLYAIYLSPDMKTRFAYGGLDYVNHQELAQQRLQDDILSYVRKVVENRGGNLIVFDCAPGFSGMEQKLLNACYDLKLNKCTDVKEEYVTTLDAGHIEKCIRCIKDSWETLRIPPEFRQVRMTLNDMQNYYEYINRDPKADAEQQFREMAEIVVARLKRESSMQNVEIYFWQYSQEIAMRSIFRHQSFVENQIDSYIMTNDSYRIYEPV